MAARSKLGRTRDVAPVSFRLNGRQRVALEAAARLAGVTPNEHARNLMVGALVRSGAVVELPLVPGAYEAVPARPCVRCREGSRRPGRRLCARCVSKKRKPWAELSPDRKAKANCRAYTNMLVRRGKLQKLPCERCGSEKSQAHHHDYTKPREVEWLCRPCHMGHHGELREASPTAQEAGNHA